MDASLSENGGGGGTDLRAEVATLFGAICRLAPELAPPSDIHSVSLNISPGAVNLKPSDIHSVSLNITPGALNLNPAYSNCPKTLALILRYLRYSVFAPLFYLALVKKHRVDDEHRDDDERKTMAVLAPELAEGSPFRDMSAPEIQEKIREGLGLLHMELGKRNRELEEELKSHEKFNKFWSVTSLVLNILLFAISSALPVAAQVTPASIMATELALLVAVIVPFVTATKVGDLLFGIKNDEPKRRLKSQKSAIEAIRRDGGSALCSELIFSAWR